MVVLILTSSESAAAGAAALKLETTLQQGTVQKALASVCNVCRLSAG